MAYAKCDNCGCVCQYHLGRIADWRCHDCLGPLKRVGRATYRAGSVTVRDKKGAEYTVPCPPPYAVRMTRGRSKP